MLDCDYDTQDKFIMVKFHYRGNVENTHMSDNNVQSYIDLLIYFEFPQRETFIFPLVHVFSASKLIDFLLKVKFVFMDIPDSHQAQL